MCLHKPMLCLLCAALLLTGCGYDPPAAETAAPPETTSAATTTTTCTTTTTTITAETQFSDDTDDLAPVPEQPPRPDFSGNVTRSGSRVLIEGVPHIYQSDRYPTACESIAATELLQYYGFDIDVDTFIRDYLPTAPYLSPGADGQYHGESPWEFFIGNPTDANGFGCYNGAIKAAFDAVSKELGSALRGAPLSALCRFIDSGEPVIIWATDGMGSETEISKSWILPDGSKFVLSRRSTHSCSSAMTTRSITSSTRAQPRILSPTASSRSRKHTVCSIRRRLSYRRKICRRLLHFHQSTPICPC